MIRKRPEHVDPSKAHHVVFLVDVPDNPERLDVVRAMAAGAEAIGVHVEPVFDSTLTANGVWSVSCATCNGQTTIRVERWSPSPRIPLKMDGDAPHFFPSAVEAMFRHAGWISSPHPDSSRLTWWCCEACALVEGVMP